MGLVIRDGIFSGRRTAHVPYGRYPDIYRYVIALNVSALESQRYGKAVSVILLTAQKLPFQRYANGNPTQHYLMISRFLLFLCKSKQKPRNSFLHSFSQTTRSIDGLDLEILRSKARMKTQIPEYILKKGRSCAGAKRLPYILAICPLVKRLHRPGRHATATSTLHFVR